MADEDSTHSISALPQVIHNALALLADNHEQLPQILKLAFERTPGETITEIAEGVAQDLDHSQEQTPHIIEAFFKVYFFFDSVEVDASEFVQTITSYIKRSEFDWLDNWEKAAAIIHTKLEEAQPNNPFSLAKKALELPYLHSNMMTDARIITDIRPVFTDEGDEIVRATIGHLLVINYLDQEKNEKGRAFFVLDADDIQKLKHLCERAEKKAATAKSQLEINWPTSIVGE